jgi:TonB-linked SusC/RagA family outer membrane protein
MRDGTWIGSVSRWALAAAVVGAACPVRAQPAATVRGTVVDSATREPVAGAQVVVGAARAQSDGAGRFVVRGVPPGPTTVRVQRVGFRPDSQAVAAGAGGAAELRFLLRARPGRLTEVVVVGYGTRSRAEVSGAVATVDGADLRNDPVAGIDAALQGRAAGVEVVQNAGNPGNGISVRVRGASSLAASTQPLYVVDGVPVVQEDKSYLFFNGQGITAVTGLAPDDVERVDVLKDAAAAAIYGARASNGVVLVTTRRGRPGPTRVAFGSYVGRQRAARLLPLLGAREYVAFRNEAATNDGLAAPFTPGVSDTVDTDWQRAVLRPAAVSDVDVSASGGGDRFRFLVGGSQFRQDGVARGSAYGRVSGRVNADVAATARLGLRSSLALGRERFARVPNDNTIAGVVSNAHFLQPNVPARVAGTGEYSSSAQGLAYANPLAIAAYNAGPATALRALGGLEAAFAASERVRVTGRLGVDAYGLGERQWNSPRVADTFAARSDGDASQASTTTTKLVAEAFADVGLRRSAADALTVTAGAGTERNRDELLFVRGTGFASDAFQYPGSASQATRYDGRASRQTLLWGFARADYALRGRYLVTASLRADGSSRFGPRRRWGVFPAASVGWTATDEPFLAGLRRVLTAKLRASYGLTGNQAIPTLYGFATLFRGANYAGDPGIAPATLGNPDLRWESTRAADVGLDLGFAGGRVSLIADYYRKTTTDLLVERPVPTASGFRAVWDNAGVLRNAGAELQLTAAALRPRAPGGLSWTADLNVARHANRVAALYRGRPFATGAVSRAAVGQPVGAFYALRFTGVDPRTGDAVYEDRDGDGAITDADRTFVGSPHPTAFGGVRNAFAWRGLDLSAFVQFARGQRVFNLTRRSGDDGGVGPDNQVAAVRRRWRRPGDVTDVPRASAGGRSRADLVSSRYVEDGSYARLQDVTLGVRLPRAAARRAGLSGARVFVTGSNLRLWTRYTGYDPDVSSGGVGAAGAFGTDQHAYPRARTTSVGLSGSF